jgi:hypothetical protein
MLALWAEMNLIVADEFRHGNVPAQQQALPVTKRAFQALPSQVMDSAATQFCVEAIPESSEAEIECADVLNYWPEAGEEKEYTALRWIGIRVKRRQGELFAHGSEYK